MLASDFLNEVYVKYRGKIASRTPAWGSDKAIVAIGIANSKKNEWATDPRNKWDSLFDIVSMGTISTGTSTYDLDDSFFMASDYAKVVLTNGEYVEYPIVKPQQRNLSSGQSLYIHGSDPRKITFTQTIDDSLDGGTLYIPGYYIPADMTLSTSVVPVDNPQWLVYVTAAELARNDPAKDDQYPTLLGTANDLYVKMSNANNDTGFLQFNSIVNNMPQVSDGPDVDWTL